MTEFHIRLWKWGLFLIMNCHIPEFLGVNDQIQAESRETCSK